jgi:S1-C subfamily serine protease
VNEQALRLATMPVTAGDGRGTGFVVGPGLLLTCHHVVRGTTRSMVTYEDRQLEIDEVRLPPLAGGEPVADLALLEVAKLPPITSVELDLRPPETGDALWAYGFTDLYPEGDSALFTFEGPSVANGEPLYRLRSSQARPGLSGAPLLNVRTGTVVGVVSRSRGKDTDLGARAVPIESAARLLPGLAAVMSLGWSAAVPDPADEHLRRLIAIHERNVRVLEAQVAGYGALDVPMHKQTQLEDERAELARIRQRLGGR